MKKLIPSHVRERHTKLIEEETTVSKTLNQVFSGTAQQNPISL
jgi:hypothetical protein